MRVLPEGFEPSPAGDSRSKTVGYHDANHQEQAHRHIKTLSPEGVGVGVALASTYTYEINRHTNGRFITMYTVNGIH